MPNQTQAKYHHLIPQTYMSPWANASGTLKVEFISEPGVVIERNKEKIAGVTDFHSIKAGMPLCTQADTDLIFDCLKPYNIEYEGNVITNTLDMNRHFYDFDKWVITRPDGSPVSKKSLRREIEKVKIKDIESNWSEKYENTWSKQVSIIEQNILNATGDSVPEFDRDYIMKFFTALDWRGFNSNAQFEELLTWLCNDIIPLGELSIPENDRMLPLLGTAAEEMRHHLLLQYYRQYLNDTGVIFQNALENLKHTSFHFLISDGPTLFITSDTPAFIHKRTDGSYVGLLPITPKILLAQGKNTAKETLYYISHITDEAVQRYNATIRENAEEFIIHNW